MKWKDFGVEFDENEKNNLQKWLRDEIWRQEEKRKRRESWTFFEYLDYADKKKKRENPLAIFGLEMSDDESDEEATTKKVGNFTQVSNSPIRPVSLESIDEKDIRTYLKFLGRI